MIPNGIPTTVANNMAQNASSKVIGRRSSTIEVTV